MAQDQEMQRVPLVPPSWDPTINIENPRWPKQLSLLFEHSHDTFYELDTLRKFREPMVQKANLRMATAEKDLLMSSRLLVMGKLNEMKIIMAKLESVMDKIKTLEEHFGNLIIEIQNDIADATTEEE